MRAKIRNSLLLYPFFEVIYFANRIICQEFPEMEEKGSPLFNPKGKDAYAHI